MSEEFTVTSTQVSHNHSDKLCDIIADTIVDTAAEADPSSSVDVCVHAKNQAVVVTGEICTQAPVFIETIVKKVMGELCLEGELSSASTLPHVLVLVDKKPPKTPSSPPQPTVDPQMYTGFATNETPECLPLPILLATKLLDEIRKQRMAKKLSFIGSDVQATVSVKYERREGKLTPKEVSSVRLEFLGDKGVAAADAQKVFREDIIDKTLPKGLLNERSVVVINQEAYETKADVFNRFGASGRRHSSDTYGGWVAQTDLHLSGRDLGRTERVGTYLARHIAKSLVSSGLCQHCEVTFSFGPKGPEPAYLRVNTLGSAKPETERSLEELVRKSFDFGATEAATWLRTGLKGHRLAFHAAYNHFFSAPESPWELPKKLTLN